MYDNYVKLRDTYATEESIRFTDDLLNKYCNLENNLRDIVEKDITCTYGYIVSKIYMGLDLERIKYLGYKQHVRKILTTVKNNVIDIYILAIYTYFGPINSSNDVK